MQFDWVTWSIWAIGFVILVIWIIVPIREFAEMVRAHRGQVKPPAGGASVDRPEAKP